MIRRVWWAWVLGAMVVTGCVASASPQACREIADQSAVGQARLNDWGSLSDAKRLAAYREAVQGFVDLDYAVNGKAVPDGFVVKGSK